MMAARVQCLWLFSQITGLARGVLLLHLGRAQEALYDVERAVREESNRPHLQHRAQVYEALGRHQEAEQDRQQALKSAKT